MTAPPSPGTAIERALNKVLERLSDAQVHDLAEVCQQLERPSDALASAVAGGAPSSTEAITAVRLAWTAAPGLTGPGIAVALRIGLAARTNLEARRARPVWTGPGAAGEQRLTASVLHELLAGAEQRILLVSFAAHTLPAIATDLATAVQRGCTVDVVFETRDDNAHYTGPATPYAQISGINRWRWPVAQRDPGAALHAKLLVIDGCRALVGSANLTHRALNANLEAGVLLSDPDTAAGLEQHIRALIAEGVLVSHS